MELTDQGSSPGPFLLFFFDQGVDILRHILRRSTRIGDVLLVVTKNLDNFLEAALLGCNFFHQASECRFDTLIEHAQSLNTFSNILDCFFQ